MTYRKPGLIIFGLCILATLTSFYTLALAEQEEERSGFWNNTNLPKDTQIIKLRKSLQGEIYDRLNLQWILLVDENTLVVPDMQNDDGANSLFFIDTRSGELLRKVLIDTRGGLVNTLWIDNGMVMCRVFLGEVDDRSVLIISVKPTGVTTYKELKGEERFIHWLDTQKIGIHADGANLYLFDTKSGDKKILLKGISDEEADMEMGTALYYDLFAPLSKDRFIYEASDGWPHGYLGYGIFDLRNMQTTALSSIGSPKAVIGSTLYATNGIIDLQTLLLMPFNHELSNLIMDVDIGNLAGWEVSPGGTRIATYQSTVYLASPMNGVRVFDSLTEKEVFVHHFDDLITVVRLNFLNENHLLVSCMSFKKGADVEPVVLIIPIP